jgi:diguanylate cyclase (GGDEF)-like protein
MRQTTNLRLVRLARFTALTIILAVTACGGIWIVDAARAQHADAARASRAAEYARVGDLARYEQSLVSANAQHYSSARSRQIERATSQLMSLLRASERGASGNSLSALSGRWGVAILLADTPARSRETDAALGAVVRAANAALARERKDAIATPSNDLIRVLGIAAALLAAVEGPLLLFWFRSRRRPLDRRHLERVEDLATQARTDALTRLGNRRAFEDDLALLIGQRAETGHGFALMAIDLDGLKRINDSKGHPAGDAHIRRVAECIRTVVGTEGSVYRTGGDEFMVVLPGRRNWHGLKLAARIEDETLERCGHRAVSIGLTESLGSEGRHLLMSRADIALYEAKRTRLSAVAYHPGLQPAGEQHLDDRPSNEQRALAAALARAVDAKDAGTRSHSETVAQLCAAIGERLRITPTNLERLRLAGLLHDVGKIGVADAILLKPDALDSDEHSAMTDHVVTGQAILLAAELPLEAHWVLHHHERVDGGGYPSGLADSAIPIESRIIAVADAFEAMTGTRPYRAAVTVEQAIEELRANAGTQFDPDCVSALVEVVNDAAGEEIFSVLSTPEDAAPAAAAKGGGGRSRRAALASAPAVPVR